MKSTLFALASPFLHPHRFLAISTLSAAFCAFGDEPKLRGIGSAMQEMVAKNEIAGAVTVVVAKDKLLHVENSGFADIASKRPMTPDTRSGSPP